MRSSDWSSDVCSSDLEIGVLAYDWSPDGKSLWYSQLKAKSGPPPIRFDDAASSLRSRRRSSIEAEVEFFLRAPDGRIDKIITRPTSDRMAMHAGGKVVWRGDDIFFRIETPDGTPGRDRKSTRLNSSH